jgi:hypothetical protein
LFGRAIEVIVTVVDSLLPLDDAAMLLHTTPEHPQGLFLVVLHVFQLGPLSESKILPQAKFSFVGNELD